MLLEKQGSTVTASYTYGNALLRKDGETPLYDGLGSSRTVTNTSASTTATMTTDAFGNAVTSSGTTACAYKFGATSGYRDDGDAGLVKVGCRYYDPETGRFTTRDTVLSQKAYLYCDANPINSVDPSGHVSKGVKIAIITAVLEVLVGLNPIIRGGQDVLNTPPVRSGPVKSDPDGDGDGDGNGGDTVDPILGGIVVGIVVVVAIGFAPGTGGASLLLLAGA